MKRSLLDPLPRQLSTKALAALVALVVCGTGVAVVLFLEAGPGTIRVPSASVRAAPSVSDSVRPPRSDRPTSRGAAFSGSDSPDAFGGSASRAAPACSTQVREDQPALYRPDVQGT
ncbi:MAG: hypothetical protein NTY35_09665 [Planctomycetota bacterium]|nr:hypothetical protein [Planctomycetota bacterium]